MLKCLSLESPLFSEDVIFDNGGSLESPLLGEFPELAFGGFWIVAAATTPVIPVLWDLGGGYEAGA